MENVLTQSVPIYDASKFVQWRRETGLTQWQVVEQSGIPRATLTRIEAGDQRVTVETLAKAATFFRKPLASALTEEGRKKFGLSV